jgi:hypothetical protein
MSIFTYERGFGFTKILKLVPISKRKTPRKKTIVLKNENEKK